MLIHTFTLSYNQTTESSLTINETVSPTINEYLSLVASLLLQAFCNTTLIIDN